MICSPMVVKNHQAEKTSTSHTKTAALQIPLADPVGQGSFPGFDLGGRCRNTAIGCAYEFLGPVDNHGISWQKSHKKPNKTHFCRDSEGSAAGHQSNFLRFCIGSKGSSAPHKPALPRLCDSFGRPIARPDNPMSLLHSSTINLRKDWTTFT